MFRRKNRERKSALFGSWTLDKLHVELGSDLHFNRAGQYCHVNS